MGGGGTKRKQNIHARENAGKKFCREEAKGEKIMQKERVLLLNVKAISKISVNVIPLSHMEITAHCDLGPIVERWRAGSLRPASIETSIVCKVTHLGFICA